MSDGPATQGGVGKTTTTINQGSPSKSHTCQPALILAGPPAFFSQTATPRGTTAPGLAMACAHAGHYAAPHGLDYPD